MNQSLPSTNVYAAINQLRQYINERIVGQASFVDRLLISLLAGGHLLVEGAPGLAKTSAIKTLAAGIEGDFQRIQFTPDLLPADLTGTDIYRPEEHRFEFQQGPLFHNFILADEVNRAPAKVQSALLEAMGEQQITVGRNTYSLPRLFMVMATQNPIEHEGTYPLPEAQLDRFMMQVNIDYPNATTEQQILKINRNTTLDTTPQSVLVKANDIFAARAELQQLHMSNAIEEYLIQLILATRDPKHYSNELANWIRFGASPRGTIDLDRAARAHAWLQQRNYVSPEDIHAVAHDVLRHRVLLNFEAEAEGKNSDYFICELLDRVAVP